MCLRHGSFSAGPTGVPGDGHFPARTVGGAAGPVGVAPAFLRAPGEARLIAPTRSGGGHRRSSRHRLGPAVRAREPVDRGTPVDVAYRIVRLEEQLERAERADEELRRREADAVRGHR
ncbi:MerR family transcriptional regulator [Streptomyces marokkonensis]|uniref:MerR family transcriptional regulator n=1 Tax=Streptomyces marokkonensis TaxID=324855 RepID=UPI0011F205E9|nr:MerR family transcriptional regulator [Streptomyces marokkonensis]